MNRFRDMRRAAARRPQPKSLQEHLERNGERNIVDGYGPALSPQAQVEAKEREAILTEAIRSLPAYQRTLVLLFHPQDRTYAEIASLMKIPMGTVKSRLFRARDRLRELLGPFKSALVDE